MTWRTASVEMWTRSFGIALVSAACLAAPARAQLARMQASPNAPKLLVVPFGHIAADSDIATEIADKFRDRIRLAHNDDFAVILKKAMCDALDQSGFSCSIELEPTQVGQLANVMNARFIADGRLFPRGQDSLLVLVRLVQAVRLNPMGTAASVVVERTKLTASLGERLADRIADKYRSFEYITRCRSEREQKNFDRAVDAAQRALRYDVESGGAYLCLALTLQDRGAPADSVQAALEQAHAADSLNTTVARQLAFMYQEKRDTANLIRMSRNILAVDINDNDLRKSVAQLYVIRGHADSAVMLLDEALGRNPTQWDLLNLKAIALGAQSKWDSAAAVMATAAEADSSKIDSTFISRTLDFYDRANDSAHVLAWVQRGTQKVPTWSGLQYRYSVLLLAKNDTAGALAAAEKFMTMVPGDGRGHLVVATLLQARGQDDSALVHAKMAGDADSTYRPAAAGIFVRAGVKALQAQVWPRADTLLTQAKDWGQGQAQQTAAFYAGVAEFQRGYGALTDAQKRQGPRVEQAQRDSGCVSLRAATDFLNQAEQNITANVAINREAASQYLTYLPQFKDAIPKMARALKCPS